MICGLLVDAVNLGGCHRVSSVCHAVLHGHASLGRRVSLQEHVFSTFLYVCPELGLAKIRGVIAIAALQTGAQKTFPHHLMEPLC